MISHWAGALDQVAQVQTGETAGHVFLLDRAGRRLAAIEPGRFSRPQLGPGSGPGSDTDGLGKFLGRLHRLLTVDRRPVQV